MTMRNALLAATFALAMAGCEADPRAPVDSEVAPAGVEDDETLRPDERSLADETETGVTRAATGLQSIPARFRGTWDYVEGDCDPASDLRMEVGERRILFYESVGEVTDIRPASDDAIIVTMELSGEGETWTETTRLRLEDGGDRLIPSMADGEPANRPLPRKRCEP